MTPFIKREYNSFEVEQDGFVLHKSSEKDRLLHESKYYEQIENTDCEVFFARRLNSYSNDKHHLLLEYYPFEDLTNLHQFKAISSIVDKIKYILNCFNQHKKPGNANFKRAMYIDKTLTEYGNLVANFDFFNKLSKEEYIFINKEKYKNFEFIKDKIVEIINRELVNDDDFTIIHGDLCFSNILMGKLGSNRVIKLIDPRGSFGEVGIYGDPLYDLAKLSHSYNGRYEDIVRDRFRLKEKKNGFKFYLPKKKINFPHLFEDGYDKKTIHKIKLIEGLIYIGMCARHYDSLPRQKAMYLTGIRILNDLLSWK